MNRIIEQYLRSAQARGQMDPEPRAQSEQGSFRENPADAFVAAQRRDLLNLLGIRSSLPIGVHRGLPNRLEYTRQEIAERMAYARGARDIATISSIESMMQRVLDSGVEYYLHVMKTTPRSRNTTRISRSFEARAFLGTVIGSGITLMDIAELMDVVSAPAYLKRVHIRHYTSGAPNEPQKLINISGDYEHIHGREIDIKHRLTLGVKNGQVMIQSRDIDVSGHARGLGFGARSLLQISLFAQRHGVRSWVDTVENDGILAWPSMGGEVVEHDLNRAAASLEELVKGGSVGRLGVNLSDADIFDMAGAVVWDKEIADERSFFEWIAAALDRLGRDPEEIEDMVEPYPVGMLALKAANLRVRYRTDKILDHLLDVYFPGRILRRGIASLDYDSTSAHRNFVAAYRRGQRERRLAAELNQGSGAKSTLLRTDLQKVPLAEGAFRPARISRIVGLNEEALPVGEHAADGGLFFVSHGQGTQPPTPVEWLSLSQALRKSTAPGNPVSLPQALWSVPAIKPVR